MVTIDLGPGETCIISSIIISHSGLNLGERVNVHVYEENEIIKACPTFMSEFELHKDMDTVCMCLGGNLIMRNCTISTFAIPQNVKVTVPAMVAMPGC